MYISEIDIENIKCFEKLILSFENNEKKLCLWNVILGDNSSGKTSLLRCIAIGLCEPTSSAALMKELSSEFLRDSDRPGIIKITLTDQQAEKYVITTKISQEHGTETINQDIKGDRKKIQRDLFICGYGIQRCGEADASYEAYSPLEAVYTLFNYYASLQNPELTLRRQSEQIIEKIFKIIKKILMLDDSQYSFELTKKGIEMVEIVGQEQRRILLSSWGDGYSSTFTWIMDFIGWQIYADRLESTSDIDQLKGILLIDEIELNLHPYWQRYFAKSLKDQFPNIQFITTSHSPIIAAGAADFSDAKLIAFKEEHGKVKSLENLPSLRGMRIDQVLTSVAFGLYTTVSLSSVNDIDRFSELMCKTRNTEEETEYQFLRTKIEKDFLAGQTKSEQLIEMAVDKALENILNSKPPDELEALMKLKLQKFFNAEKNK